MINRPFYSRPKFYEKTIQDSENVYAKHAVLEAPDGTTTDGIAVFTNGFLQLTLTVDGAYLLANAIVDAVEELKKGKRRMSRSNVESIIRAALEEANKAEQDQHDDGWDDQYAAPRPSSRPIALNDDASLASVILGAVNNRSTNL